MTMMPATAMTLIAKRIQKPLERNPSEISRRATRATGRSTTHGSPAMAGSWASASLGSADVSSSAGRPTRSRKTSASVRRSNPKRLTAPQPRAASSAGWARSTGTAITAGDAQPDGAIGVAQHGEVLGIELRRPPSVGGVGHVDEEDRIVTGGELVERALGDGTSAVDDDGVLAQVLDEVELVRREQHRGATPRLGHEDLGQGVDGDRVEPGERLVEDEHVRFVDEGADQLDALLVAEREVLEVAADPVAEVEALEPGVGPAAASALSRPRSWPR